MVGAGRGPPDEFLISGLQPFPPHQANMDGFTILSLVIRV